jgi:hypothetical protein
MPELPLNIPTYWNTVKLGDLGIISSEGTRLTKIREYFDGKVPKTK